MQLIVMPLKIAVIGYGKMGREIEQAAKDKGMIVQAIIDPTVKRGGIFFNKIDSESMAGVDACIDFTTPAAVVENAKKISSFKKNIVIGTTGWYDKLPEIKDAAKKGEIGIIYAPNFSIGVNLFFRVLAQAAKLFDKFQDYDAYIYELHHSQKLDSPSGTAKKCGEIILANMKRKSKAVYDKLDRKIEPSELHVASVRAGNIPGTHTVGFDSKADTIELTHTARGRVGFAAGAVLAAEWLGNKKGVFTMDDMLKDVLEVG